MLALADRFKNIQDPIQKSAIAMQLMGRGSVNMVGFLSQGSAAIKGMGVEAEHLGVILSNGQVQALVKVEHALHEVEAIFKALAATVASYFAPSIETAIKDFVKFYEINKKLIDTNIREWVWDITFALGFVWEAVKTVTQAFFNFAEAHQTLTRRVIEFLIALGLLVGAIWATQKVLGLLKGSFDLLKLAVSPFKFLWSEAFAPAVLWIGGLVKTALVELTSSLAALALETFPALGVALGSFSALIEATPIGWLITGIAALVVVLHDAWTLLTGGNWSDTWVSKAYEAVRGFGGKALSFLGLGGDQDQSQSGAGKLQDFQGLGDISNIGAASGVAPASAAAGNSSYSVNAPITINVPHGTNEKTVGDKVKEGVAEHLDRVYRRTQQSLRPAQAY
jgi:hypothetical protein